MNVYDFRGRADSGVDTAIEDVAYAVIGAAIEVHRHLGPGLPEKVYKNALSYELELRGIQHVVEAPVPIDYKGRRVGEGSIDILVGNVLVLELKVVDRLTEVNEAQALAYLKAKKLTLGLLINFNVMLLADGIRRIINTM